MKLLAIDTSTAIASVALMVGDEFISEEQGSQKTHAQLLLPMIERLMVQTGSQLNQLDGIIFGCGPGSFTGLRIACSIAKGLAYAHDLGLIPVSSLGAIAFAVRKHKEYKDSPILAVLDARMHELYWSYFAENQLVSADKVNAAQGIQLADMKSVVIAGVGVDLYWDAFSNQLKTQLSAKLELYPKAESMIELALKAEIRAVSAGEAQPVYVRNQVTQGDSSG